MNYPCPKCEEEQIDMEAAAYGFRSDTEAQREPVDNDWLGVLVIVLLIAYVAIMVAWATHPI